MFKVSNGRLILIPDDDRITQDLAAIRVRLNAFLQEISSNTPEIRKLREQYLSGALPLGFDWFTDAK